MVSSIEAAITPDLGINNWQLTALARAERKLAARSDQGLLARVGGSFKLVSPLLHQAGSFPVNPSISRMTLVGLQESTPLHQKRPSCAPRTKQAEWLAWRVSDGPET